MTSTSLTKSRNATRPRNRPRIVKALKEIRELSQPLSPDYQKAFKRLQHCLVRGDILAETVESRSGGLLAILVIVGWMVSPIGALRQPMITVFCAIAGSLLVMGLLYGLTRITDSDLLVTTIVIMIAACSGYAGFLMLSRPGPSWQPAVWGIAFSGFWTAAALTTSFFGLNAFHSVIERRYSRRYPDAWLTHNLAIIVGLLSDPDIWRSSEDKQDCIVALEECAVIMERYLPKAINTLDAWSASWVRNESKRRAAVFRDLKKWVYQPQADTREILYDKVLKMLSHALDGHWHYFPTTEPPRLSPSQIRRNIIRVLILIAQSSTPVVLVMLWKLSPVAPPKDIFEKLLITVSAISVIYLLIGLDPSAEARFKGASSLANSFLRGKDSST